MNRKQRRAAGKGAANNQGSGPDAGAAPGIAEWLAAALAHHQQGRLAEAETLYRQILAADPRHSDSLHLLGVIATQVGRNDAAVELIGRAILLNNRAPAFHNNLGNALRACGRPAEAIDPYRRAMSLQPDYAEAHDNLGNALSDLGRHAAAVES